jgi:CheY-like chemotaxis protein
MSAPLPLRILLAEDDSNDVLFFRRAASKLGLPWDIEVAGDGETAARILAEDGAPGHVVLDLKLPRRSGLEVLAGLRADPSRKAVRVIVLTSSQERRDLDEATRLGVDRYLVKPVSSRELMGAVSEIARLWGGPLAT